MSDTKPAVSIKCMSGGLELLLKWYKKIPMEEPYFSLYKAIYNDIDVKEVHGDENHRKGYTVSPDFELRLSLFLDADDNIDDPRWAPMYGSNHKNNKLKYLQKKSGVEFGVNSSENIKYEAVVTDKLVMSFIVLGGTIQNIYRNDDYYEVYTKSKTFDKDRLLLEQLLKRGVFHDNVVPDHGENPNCHTNTIEQEQAYLEMGCEFLWQARHAPGALQRRQNALADVALHQRYQIEHAYGDLNETIQFLRDVVSVLGQLRQVQSSEVCQVWTSDYDGEAYWATCELRVLRYALLSMLKDYKHKIARQELLYARTMVGWNCGHFLGQKLSQNVCCPAPHPVCALKCAHLCISGRDVGHVYFTAYGGADTLLPPLKRQHQKQQQMAMTDDVDITLSKHTQSSSLSSSLLPSTLLPSSLLPSSSSPPEMKSGNTADNVRYQINFNTQKIEVDGPMDDGNNPTAMFSKYIQAPSSSLLSAPTGQTASTKVETSTTNQSPSKPQLIPHHVPDLASNRYTDTGEGQRRRVLRRGGVKAGYTTDVVQRWRAYGGQVGWGYLWSCVSFECPAANIVEATVHGVIHNLNGTRGHEDHSHAEGTYIGLNMVLDWLEDYTE